MNSNSTFLGINETSTPRAAYIHVPFCAHRCGYCDFTLIAGRDDLVGDYLRALEMEMANAQIPHGTSIDTLFFGGGTPTHPRPEELQKLFQVVGRYVKLSPSAEMSVEANPLDLTDEKIDVLVAAGVNRVSLGVQSFSHRTLQLLERDHHPQDISDVVRRLRRHIKNISIDLIFGVPGLSLFEWKETLRQSIDLEPTHISTYGLTFEQGTAFWTRRERGDISSTDEEMERDQYRVAMEDLGAAGFEQYEISNFARPGFQCRHNHVYWNGEEYFAFGPGAARYRNGKRETNIRSVLGWLSRIERNESPVTDVEELDAQHRARELIYLGLRRNEGVSRALFHDRTGFQLDDFCKPSIDQQSSLGMIVDDGAGIRLSSEGRFIADRVVMQFL